MKFGKIEDPSIFTMKQYAKDTMAEALVLGDFGESQIVFDQKEGFVFEYYRHFRAKIFTKNGYDWATKNIILYHNRGAEDKLYALKGSVYNMENGKLVESELGKDMIHEEVIDNKHTETKFTLPNVREGCVIEYTYKIRSPFLDIPEWRFQYTIPALWSEYRVSYPEYFQYKTLQKGYLFFDVNQETTKPVRVSIHELDRNYNEDFSPANKNRQSVYEFSYTDYNKQWIKKEVPAFHEEPYMNALINYLCAIELELAAFNPPAGLVQNFTNSWEKINKQLLEDEDFGLQIRRGGFLKDVVDTLKTISNDPIAQMKVAFEFIRNSMKWDERERVYTTQGLRNAWDKKSGSSADINLMLVALLREMGFEADPVIMSTRSNGFIHQGQIMLGQFNYVIASAKIGENTYLMDATEKACPYNLLPSKCINGQGRVISEKKPGWIDLTSTAKATYTNVANMAVGEDGSLNGKMQRAFGNFAALDKRSEIMNKENHDAYIRDLENSVKGLSIGGYELLNIDSTYKSYNENLDVKLSDYVMKAGNILSFSPLMNDQWISNPFKMEERKFPVDFTFPRLYKSVISYSLPDGYLFEEKPADMMIAMADGKTKFTYRISLMNNKLILTCTLDIGKSMYSSEEYELLKEFFKQVVSKQAERIVLKKSI